MDATDRTSEFVQLLTQNQRRIYAFIRAHVVDAHDADDILQETSTILWRKFDQYDRSQDFTRWACGVARLEVFRHARYRKKVMSGLSALAADQYAAQVLRLAERQEDRTRALAECLQLLDQQQRDLIERRYQSGQEVEWIARETGKSVPTVYRLLARIHDLLFDCILRKLAAAELS